MADRVQNQLEETIDELEDLIDRRIFSKDEVKMIVAKRRDFEYLLQRRTPLKEDFLRYIDYEIQLDKLRAKRKERKGIRMTGVADKMKRIHVLFTRALRKFRGDVELWHVAIKHARDVGAHQIAEKRLSESVRLHPRHTEFWVEAAKFHFETNNDISTARTVLQTGIRINRNSSLLWAEMLRLEALYMFQIRKRRAILGIDDENGNPVPGKDGEVETEDQELAKHEVIFNGKILRIVYYKAIAALPDSLELRKEMSESLVPFFDTMIRDPTLALGKDIWIDATEGDRRVESAQEYCWEERALFHFKYCSQDETPRETDATCLEIFQKGCQSVKSELMSQLYVEFMAEQIRRVEKSNKDESEDEGRATRQRSRKRQRSDSTASDAGWAKNLRDLVLALLEECENGSMALNEKTLTQIAEIFNEQRVVERCHLCNSASPVVAGSYLSFLKSYSEGVKLLKTAEKIIEKTKTAFLKNGYETNLERRKEMQDLLSKYLEIYVGCEEISFDRVLSAFLESMKWMWLNCKDSSENLLSGFLSWVASGSDFLLLKQVVRKLELGGVPPVLPVGTYSCVIEQCLSITENPSAKEIEIIRSIFESAVRFHTSDNGLWLEFVKFERKFGSLETEKTIIVRALKAAKDSESFQSELTAL